MRRAVKAGLICGGVFVCLLPLLLVGMVLLGVMLGPEVFTDSSASPSATYLREELGIIRDEYTVIHEEDSHGGVHGDGLYFVVLDCSEKIEDVQKLTADWREVPLPEDLHRVLYGRYVYEFDPVGSGQFPVVENEPGIPAPQDWEFRFPLLGAEAQSELAGTEEFRNMPIWPARDSVKVIGDTVVVKLSEPEPLES